MRASRRLGGLMLAALMAVGPLVGCATFGSSRRVDLGPFSENTLGMIGELQTFNRPPTWARLKRYQNLPSVAAARQSVGRVRVLMRGVALYSMQITSLYDSPLSEKRKITELARYMEETIRPGLTTSAPPDLGLSPGYMDTLIQQIRQRKTFLKALSAAQPVVNLTVTAGDMLFDDLDETIQVASADLSAHIEAEFGSLELRVADLNQMHVASVRSFTLLQRYRGGDQAALDSLRLTDPMVGRLVPGRSPTSKDLGAAEAYVIDRSAKIKTLREQLEPEFVVYRENRAELEAFRTQADERARLGRAALFLWARSHRNLAAGIQVPPMIDIIGIMKGTVSGGVKGIIP
jgi:hypothetical protein